MKTLLQISLIFLVAVSCNTPKEAMEKSQPKQSILSGNYQITEVKGAMDLPEKLTINFDAEAKSVNGFAGCNSFFGSFTTTENNLTFGAIGASKKYCEKKLNTLEYEILDALNSAITFSIEGSTLYLHSKDKIVLKAEASHSEKTQTSSDMSYHKAIVYQTSARGAFEYLSISKETITISEDRNLQKMAHYSCSENDWEVLNNLIEQVDLETLHTLNVPSNLRMSDAAAEATLAIQIGDVQYMTPAFDHGNPPKEIETLVNKVLSVKEKTLKQ